MPDIYEMEHAPEVNAVLEDLRKKIAQSVGVTLNGNRLTCRWYHDGKLVDVHAVILNVSTPTEVRERESLRDRVADLMAKYPELEEDFFWTLTGEHSQ